MAAKGTDSNTASAPSLELQLFSEADVATTRAPVPKPVKPRPTRQPSKAEPTLLNQSSFLLEEPEQKNTGPEPDLFFALDSFSQAPTKSSEQDQFDEEVRNIQMTQVLAPEKVPGMTSPFDEEDEELSAEFETSFNDDHEHEESLFDDPQESSSPAEETDNPFEPHYSAPAAKAALEPEQVTLQKQELPYEQAAEANPEMPTAAVNSSNKEALSNEPEDLVADESTPSMEDETVDEATASDLPSANEEEASPAAEEAPLPPQTQSFVEHVQPAVSLVFPPGIEFSPSAETTIHSKPYPAPEEPVRTTLSQVIGSLPAQVTAAPTLGQAPVAEYQAEEEAEPEMQPLPPELRNVAAALERAMPDPMLLPTAFSTFCGAAYAKPEWAGAASDYLSVLFEEHQDILAEMTRVPDLIIELGAGHYTLTFMVASRWAAKADLARLTRLAEALIAAHAKLSSPEVVDLMLALTTSLAISRYPRAEQLLAAAEAHATEDEQEALNEAHLWLGAGKVVRLCTQDVRDLWDQRLRRPRVAWTWNSREECDALTQVAETLDPNSHAARLFHAVVPACWWSMLVERAHERAQYENALSAAKTAGQGRNAPSEESPSVTTREVVRQPIIVWRGIPFFIGGLVGAWALLLGIWLGPFDLVRPTEEAVAQVAPIAENVAPENASPPVPVAEHPNALWRKDRIASLEVEAPELRRLVEQVGMGTWSAYEALLKGETPELPKTEDKYQKLLLWLHLDPPADAEIRKQVPLMLVALRQDSTIIDLWQKLVYPGSLNAVEIQSAALRTLHDNVESWSASQRKALGDLARVPVGMP